MLASGSLAAGTEQKLPRRTPRLKRLGASYASLERTWAADSDALLCRRLCDSRPCANPAVDFATSAGAGARRSSCCDVVELRSEFLSELLGEQLAAAVLRSGGASRALDGLKASSLSARSTRGSLRNARL
eukprot:scaffold7258_cov383-Prasinococcus_capsulatus_cf.AAC.1